MPNLGVPELLIILVIIVVLFGVGRLSRISGEMGSAIREFRKGLAGDDVTAQAAVLGGSFPAPGTARRAWMPEQLRDDDKKKDEAKKEEPPHT